MLRRGGSRPTRATHSKDSCDAGASRRRAAALALLLIPLIQAAAFPRDELAEERERARVAASRIELEFPVAPAGPVTAFIRTLGGRLARGAGPSPFPWRFTVIRDRSANAFSIGGGRIYVNEGTAFVCRNEAELAAILAHEMGHELAGHFRSAPRSDGAWPWLGGLFGARGAGSDPTIGSIEQHLDPQMEREADRLSISILKRAGYDPHAALSVAELLAATSEPHARHLGDGGRIRALEELLAKTPATGRLDSEEFRRLKRETAPGTE
jgi:predicted Zn-dependent protease